jgi:hypothetical protein
MLGHLGIYAKETMYFARIEKITDIIAGIKSGRYVATGNAREGGLTPELYNVAETAATSKQPVEFSLVSMLDTSRVGMWRDDDDKSRSAELPNFDVVLQHGQTKFRTSVDFVTAATLAKGNGKAPLNVRLAFQKDGAPATYKKGNLAGKQAVNFVVELGSPWGETEIVAGCESLETWLNANTTKPEQVKAPATA